MFYMATRKQKNTEIPKKAPLRNPHSVRLPEEMDAALSRLCAANASKAIDEIRRALAAHLRSYGLWPGVEEKQSD